MYTRQLLAFGFAITLASVCSVQAQIPGTLGARVPMQAQPAGTPAAPSTVLGSGGLQQRAGGQIRSAVQSGAKTATANVLKAPGASRALVFNVIPVPDSRFSPCPTDGVPGPIFDCINGRAFITASSGGVITMAGKTIDVSVTHRCLGNDYRCTNGIASNAYTLTLDSDQQVAAQVIFAEAAPPYLTQIGLVPTPLQIVVRSGGQAYTIDCVISTVSLPGSPAPRSSCGAPALSQ
jgi:hypothetical protein